MAIARKPPGSWYGIVLKVDGLPVKHTLLDTHGKYPRPELGTRCVCCDVETTRRRPFDPSGDLWRGAPIEFPLCMPCNSHVQKDSKVAGRAALGLMGGIGLTAGGSNRDSWVIASFGIALLAITAAWFLADRAKRRRAAATGHHIGLELSVQHGMCTVRTTNPRLADEVAERNRDLVALAR